MSETPSSAKPGNKSRSPLRWIIITLVVLAGGVWAVHAIRLSLSTEKTDDAFITGHIHRIGVGVAGNLLEVDAQDNQEVRAGDLLARIDPLEFEIMEKQSVAALEQAKARMTEAEAKVTQAKSAELQADAVVAVANADIQQHESVLALFRLTLERNESLVQTSAVAKADIDQARSAVTGAEATLAGSEAQLASARAGKETAASAIAVAQAEIASAKADIDARQASILEARRLRQLTEVTAPVSGRIGNRNAEAGNRVQVGQPLFALVGDDNWIVANFKETQLEKMCVGQSVDITIDALGGRHFSGRVDSIAPSTGAQFALLPPDNATGNFTKVVQRVPVKITFDPDSIHDFKTAMRPGLSAVVRVKL
ncbi:MAG: HlyD family secretion protein [Luteolibacter sp.]